MPQTLICTMSRPPKREHKKTDGKVAADRLAIRVALRYLWSRKSHSAVTAIAIAGVCGVAVATMAIVCVLSVFNGFHQAILERDTRITPDLLVTPSSGPLIANADSLAEAVSGIEGVKAVTPAVTDEAVAYNDGMQLPVKLIGVRPKQYRSITAIDSIIISGRWAPQPQEVADREAERQMSAEDASEIAEMAAGEFDEAALFEQETLTTELPETDTLPVSPIIVSRGTAGNLALPPVVDAGIMVFLPRRTGSDSFTDPATAFMVDSLAVTGIFSSEQAEFDAATIIMDLEVARRLLEYDTQANALYVGFKPGADYAKVSKSISQAIGSGYKVTGREEQQTLHFRMVAIEKWITFLLLSFILLIASFNIISTLTMLIVEKRSNIRTMTGYGASRGFIGRVFFWESIVVCLTGSMAGIATGVTLCLLQQQFGFIRIPGDPEQAIMSVYPVSVSVTDLLTIFTLSLAVAAVTGLISAAYASRIAAQRRI